MVEFMTLPDPVLRAGASAGPEGPASPARAPRPARRKDSPSKATRRRRSMAIRAYVGPNGSGKTEAAVRDLLPSVDAGRRILSTVPIYDSRTGDLYSGYIKFDSWSLLLDPSFQHADVLMDEVTGIASARASMGMPIQVQSTLDKLRKRDITLSWTAPAWGRADTTIRSTTIGVTLCTSYLSARDRERRHTGEIKAWRPKRLFRLRTFDATAFEEFSVDRAQGIAQKHRRLRARVVEWHWGPGSRAFASYDTYDAVSRVGEVLDSGRCAHCGGRRAIPVCTCEA